MKTNLFNTMNGTQYRYIIDSINVEDFGNEDMNDRERINLFFETFKQEYGYNVARMGERAAVADYLRGLPSIIHIPFANYQIAELLESWGIAATDRNLSNYWNVCACRLLKLRDSLND